MQLIPASATPPAQPPTSAEARSPIAPGCVRRCGGNGKNRFGIKAL